MLQHFKNLSYFRCILSINQYFVILLVIAIFAFLSHESILAISNIGFGFLTHTSWFPSEGQYNLTPILVGSWLTALGTIAVVIPCGISMATYLHYFCTSKLKTLTIKVLEIYTGIPSVVFGLVALVNLVPIINTIAPPGQGLLTAILVLTIMILPIFVLQFIATLNLVPTHYKKISLGLGLDQNHYITKVVLPYLSKSILSISLTTFGRAIGETMAVLMIAGNIIQIPKSIFDPIRTVTANIALEMAYAVDVHRSALFFCGALLLLTICVFMFFIALSDQATPWQK